MKDFTGCFLTGTAAEVTPVSQIDKFQFKVCNTINDLSEGYQNLVRKISCLIFLSSSLRAWPMPLAKVIVCGINC